MLRDKKTYDENGQLYPGDNLEDVIANHQTSLRECRETLWKAAEKADWYDNVTAILCKICSGAGDSVAQGQTKENHNSLNTQENPLNKTFDGFTIRVSRKKLVLFCIVCFSLFCCVLAGLFINGKTKKKEEPKPKVQTVDSIKNKPKVQTTDSIIKKETVDTEKAVIPPKYLKVKKTLKSENKANNKKELKQEEAKPSKENKTNGFKIEKPIGNAQDELTHIKAQKGNKKEDGTPVKKKQEQSK